VSGFSTIKLLDATAFCTEVTMRTRWNLKWKVIRSGKRQYEVARDAGLSESRLSRFLAGLIELRPDETARLESALASPAKISAETRARG
jgi:hypothetical protein